MKVKEITKPGFYKVNEELIFEVLENTDEKWLKEKPEDKLILDEWCFGYKQTEKTHIYETTGSLFSLNLDYADIDVEPMAGYRFKIFGNMGAMLKVTKVNKKMKLQDIKKKGFYWNSNNKKIIYEVYQNTLKSWLEERPQDDLIVDVWEYDYTEKDCIYFYTDGVPISREYCPNIDMEEIIQYNFELIDESGFLMVARRKNEL